MGGNCSNGNGGGAKRCAFLSGRGETYSPHTGSMSKRCPSISTIKVECPSHVTRRPELGAWLNRELDGWMVGSVVGRRWATGVSNHLGKMRTILGSTRGMRSTK